MSFTIKRRFPRISASIEVRYEYGGEILTGQTLNLSPGGLYINTIRPLEVGSLITVQFSLPGFDQSFKISGKVVRQNSGETPEGRSGMAIEFTGAAKKDEHLLLQYIVQSQLTQKGY